MIDPSLGFQPSFSGMPVLFYRKVLLSSIKNRCSVFTLYFQKKKRSHLTTSLTCFNEMQQN